MVYVLSHLISTSEDALWMEGNPYAKEVIYDINSQNPKHPPVHYEKHIIKPHSLPHIDTAGHTIKNGDTLETYFKPERMKCFYGKTLVVKFKNIHWQASPANSEVFEFRISKDILKEEVKRLLGTDQIPEKIFIAPEDLPKTSKGLHDPRYAFVLREDAAEWLVSNPNFNAYGTSWKSSDFQPQSRERPIHNILFRNAIIYECLKLDHVPEGEYFLSGFPIPLSGATEAPVCPILFKPSEMS